MPNLGLPGFLTHAIRSARIGAPVFNSDKYRTYPTVNSGRTFIPPAVPPTLVRSISLCHIVPLQAQPHLPSTSSSVNMSYYPHHGYQSMPYIPGGGYGYSGYDTGYPVPMPVTAFPGGYDDPYYANTYYSSRRRHVSTPNPIVNLNFY
jgi:hypothetical protein